MKNISLGCEQCRQSALIGMAAPLQKIGTAAGPTFVYQCAVCRTFWEENLREAHPISQADAQGLCPDLKDEPKGK